MTYILRTRFGRSVRISQCGRVHHAHIHVYILLCQSEVQKDALASSTGVRALKHDITSGSPIPDSLEGQIIIGAGDELIFNSIPGSNVTSALQVLKDEIIAITSSFGVPKYAIMPDTTSLPSSGIALSIETKQLHDNRAKRIRLNKSQIKRLVDLEKVMLSAYLDIDIMDSDISFDPGKLDVPNDPLVLSQSLMNLKTLGVVDDIAILSEYFGISESDAKEYVDTINSRKTKVNLPTPAPSFDFASKYK